MKECIRKDLHIHAPYIEHLLINEFWGSLNSSNWVTPENLLHELLDKAVLDYSSKIPCPPTRRFATHLLGTMTEQERQGFIERVFTSKFPDDAMPQVVGLWGLGNEFLRIGRYSLAAGIFLQAALSEQHNPLSQAVLLVKAGTAFNNGGWGPNVDYCLANALNIIMKFAGDHVGGNSTLGIALAKCMVHYHLARRELFRDDYSKAEENLNLAIAALSPLKMKEIGLNCQLENIPDFTLLRARIGRSQKEALGSQSSKEVETYLESAQKYGENTLLLRAPIEQLIIYHYSMLYRFLRKFDVAMDYAEQAFYSVTKTQLAEAMSNPFRDTTEPINTRRIGYCYNLVGEILRDQKEYSGASKYFELAEEVWMEPHYSRGLSRAKRNHAYCLMGMGKNWHDASRLLKEAIVHSRGVSDSGGEIRALAQIVGLHQAMGHSNKVEDYEAELSAAKVNYCHSEKIVEANSQPPQREEGSQRKLPKEVTEYLKNNNIYGEDDKFRDALYAAYSMAKTDLDETIILVGETGTGKDSIARLIHDMSSRANGPFIELNINTLPETLLEERLFGRGENAFTGSGAARDGLIGSSHGGTLFINEIQDFPIDIQDRLLSVIEYKSFTRIGENHKRGSDFRLICGTQVPLQTLRNTEKLRLDLYHRIDNEHILLPPLRQRPRDLQILGTNFFTWALERAKLKDKNICSSLSTEAWQLLGSYEWPGNARELRNLMKKLVTRLATEENPFVYVSESKELKMEFVSRVFEAHRAKRDVHEDPFSEPRQKVLHAKIPITPHQLRDHCGKKHFHNLRELVDSLIDQFPAYDGTHDAVIRKIYRVPEFKAVIMERSYRKASPALAVG